ncbi:MAG: hypothetical protein JNL39_20925 [Opitutaceae bacterium]|nr:hypothetical protein [Opitutaceae bacterium]
MNASLRFSVVLFAFVVGFAAVRGADLRDALVFHAPFDASADAAFARGDRRVFTAVDRAKRDAAAPGLPSDGTARLASGAGRFGGALEFRGATKQQVFFRGPANVGFVAGPWSGSVSLWLRLDPDRDLAPGYCDPFQFVGAKWGDGALFVEFTKDHNPRHFRYGIFPVTKFWNPQNKKLEEMADTERPMVPVRRPIFGRDRWTHILVTFANLNSGRADGRGALYVDGERIGASEGWNHTFNWADPAQTALTLGLNYTGLIDDVAIFDRELTAAEARVIFALPRGIAQLHSPQP